jgi:hypothetical protein
VRKFPVAVAALLLLLTACGHEGEVTPGQSGQQFSPDALPVKLDALSTDQCYLNPRTQTPKGCEKYVTELGGTAGAVRQRGGGTSKPLNAEADALDHAVAAYRSASCSTVTTPGGPCTDALSDIANAVSAIKQLVKTQATPG